MSAVIHTAQWQPLLADCTQTLGFVCHQRISGVFALLQHGPLHLQLWACGAEPGRWEQKQPRDLCPAPEHHSVAVQHIHRLHENLRRALMASSATSERSTAWRERLSGPPVLQTWGAWEFALHLHGGHVLHCVDWSAYLLDPEHQPHITWRDSSAGPP